MEIQRSGEHERLGLLDTISGYYAARVLDFLVITGAMRSLGYGRSVERVATDFGFEVRTLVMLLRYLEQTTDFFMLEGDGPSLRVSLGSECHLTEIEHLSNLYVGAFGPCFDKLADVLRGAEAGPSVDLERHALAFASDRSLDPYLPKLLLELKVSHLLDVGCGGGELLTYLASVSSTFTGIGVDFNRHVMNEARERGIESAGRIQWFECNVMELDQVLSREARDDVDALCMRSVLNAFFSDGGNSRVIKTLSYLKSTFPGRILIVADYYGKLSSCGKSAGPYRRTILHDCAQLVSSQGVPPAGQEGWEVIYRQAEVNLIQPFHYEGQGVQHFMHLLQL